VTHLELSAALSYAKLAAPQTVDDFVGLFLVSVYPGNAPDWIVYAAGNSGDHQTFLTIDNGNVILSWDEGRGSVCNASGSVPNGVSLVRVSLQYGEWKMAWTGQAEQSANVGGDSSTNPVSFDLIGARGIHSQWPGYCTPGCHVLKAAILPGHPTAEDVARVEVGMAGYQLS
jgi:hypothetical protein